MGRTADRPVRESIPVDNSAIPSHPVSVETSVKQTASFVPDIGRTRIATFKSLSDARHLVSRSQQSIVRQSGAS